MKNLSAKLADNFGLDQKKADTATAVSIRRIIERNLIPDLKCYQKGIYYLAKTTPFGDTPIDSNLLVFNKYIADDNGYESGLGELHLLGLVTQMPKQRLIVSNAAYDCARTDNKLDVVIKPPKTTVNKDTKEYLQILDVIDLLDKAPIDADNPYRRIFKHIENLKLDFVKLMALANNYYSKKVVIKLGIIASAGINSRDII